MIFVNDEKLDFSRIVSGKSRDLEDPIVDALLVGKALIDSKYAWPLKFKCPKQARGMKDGKKDILMPLTTTFETPKGTKKITYCESAPLNKNTGVPDYQPRNMWFKKTLTLNEEQIELALFLLCFHPHVKSGLILLEDIEGENISIAQNRAASSALNFYLYNDASPIYDDFDRLVTLASAWGVYMAWKRSITQLKNMIFDAVEIAEKNNDKEFGYQAFAAEMKGISKGKLALSVAQRADQSNLVSWDSKSNTWLYSAKFGEQKPICKVSPVDVSRRIHVLAAFLASHEQELETMEMALTGRTMTNEETEKVAATITQDTNLEEMKPGDIRKLAIELGINTWGKNKDALIGKIREKIS